MSSRDTPMELAKSDIIVKYAVVRKCKMCSVHHSGKRVFIAIIKFVSLGSHLGVPHDYIRIIVQSEMNLMSGVSALVNRKIAVVVE